MDSPGRLPPLLLPRPLHLCDPLRRHRLGLSVVCGWAAAAMGWLIGWSMHLLPAATSLHPSQAKTRPLPPSPLLSLPPSHPSPARPSTANRHTHLREALLQPHLHRGQHLERGQRRVGLKAAPGGGVCVVVWGERRG
jgi:hypothetical protein